ncbi:zf-ZPR1-domain-containing protein [Clavulina sp. PMI_390]|nr:zf-ZPR1-domain-containing protein [Clavulina sp. PMI_390]
MRSNQLVLFEGISYTLKVLDRDDLDRQLVKSAACTLTIPEFQLTIPSGKGQLTTVEGILRDTVLDLSADQPLRRIQDEKTYQAIQKIIDPLTTIIADTDSDDEKLSDDTRAVNRKARLEKPIQTFTVILDDPSGDSFLEFKDTMADPRWSMRQYNRSREQNEKLGLAAPGPETGGPLSNGQPTQDVIDSSLTGNEEIFVFPDTMMKKVVIPYFKSSWPQDIIIMSTNCMACGYRDNEVKSGGAVSDHGKKITLKVEDSEDLARDILKSESCGFEIPEIGLQLQAGTLGGRFTTLEGILSQVFDELSQKVIAAERPFTVILDDPLANSYLQNLYAPDDDPNMQVETYERSFEQNEELGLNDIKLENYGEEEDEGTSVHPETLTDETPSLMPFHISHTGPGPISTYFVVKTITNDAAQSLDRSTFISSFRGRMIQALKTSLPNGYTGLAFKIDPANSSEGDEQVTNQLKRPRRSTSPTKPKKRVKEVVTGSRRSRRVSRDVLVVEEPVTAHNEDIYAMMSEVVQEEEAEPTEPTALQNDAPSRSMLPVASFQSVLVWYPDVVLNDGRDEYLRSMDEWTRLAMVVSLT